MGVPELRKELHAFINQADERFLNMVYAMVKEYKEDVIVGYNIDGTSITHEDLKARVKNASKRVKSGDFLTQDEVAKEVEGW